MTESVPLDRNVVYIKCIPEKSLLLFQAGQIVKKMTMETRKQSLDPRTNNQYSHTCL